MVSYGRHALLIVWITMVIGSLRFVKSQHTKIRLSPGDSSKGHHLSSSGRGHVEIVKVAVKERGDVGSRTRVYSVAVISIDVGEPYEIEWHQTSAGMKSMIRTHNATGILRLICGTDIFESHSLLIPAQNASFLALPHQLVAEDDASKYLPTHLANFGGLDSFVSDRGGGEGVAVDTFLRAFLVTEAEGERTDRFPRFSSSTFSDESNLKACRLKVLRPSEQSLARKKVVRTKSGVDRYGVYTLDLDTLKTDKEDEPLNNPEISNSPSAVSPHWRKQIRERYFESLVERSKQGNCVRHPKVSPAFLQIMAKSRARGILDGILPIDSIASALGNSLAGAFAGGMESSAADLSTAVLQTEVGSGLVEQISTMMKETLLVSLSETIVDTTSETIAAGLQQRVAYYLTSSLSRELTRAIDRRVAERVPEEIGERAAGRTALLLMSGLAQTLSRSVSQSLVPALLHTISHSPLQDYYCYYCYHHGVYCSYCHYAPLQLYYAQYYVSYYAPYYGEWSSNFFKRALDLEFLQQMRNTGGARVGTAFHGNEGAMKPDSPWGKMR
eukprot:g1465.t1